MWSLLFASWNPHRYNLLREKSVKKILKVCIIAALLSSILFIALLAPSAWNANNLAHKLGETTNVTIKATFKQTGPTYLSENPDILFTTGEGNGFIVITNEKATLRMLFGSKSFEWSSFSSPIAFTQSNVYGTLLIFILPSILFWCTLFLLIHAIIGALLYSLCAYFVLHARNFRVAFIDVIKGSAYATVPSMMLFAVSPILRLGLNLWIISGFVLSLWLVLSMLATAQFAEKHVSKHRL